MSHLLVLSIGPVQEFIAAARRTRDLWFGSYLLSEISRAVAKKVEERGGALIFPASVDAPNVANVILAELPNEDPRAVAREAKEAAEKRWREFAETAWRKVSEAIHEDVWNDQINDVIEFQAAWVSTTGDENYRADRAKVMRLLAGRKNCRDFKPAFGRPGTPKSSLDGRRESVLKDEDREIWSKKLRLSSGEQLDVVGVAKRLGRKVGSGDPRYPSVARIAADPWLRGVEAKHPSEFERLKDACGKLKLKGLNGLTNEAFPYEGTIVYRDRHANLREELGLNAEDPDLAEAAAALRRIGGEPNPYLAVLVADGDKMGAAISQRTSPEDHRRLSAALSGFAGEAKAIVDAHRGVLVYAGGDDVLAFLPVDKCLNCARELHEVFGRLLSDFGKPTLSVGIAIGHFMENLEDLLNWGRAAEKAAKEPDRDGLAIHLHKRGGAPIRVRSRWTDDGPPDQRINDYANLIQNESLPGGLPYELQKLADLYDGWPQETKTAALRADVSRVIGKKNQGAGVPASIERTVGTIVDAEELRGFARELLVARLVAGAMRQTGGEKTS